MTGTTPVLQAVDLHRDYPVRRGLFAAPAVVQDRKSVV